MLVTEEVIITTLNVISATKKVISATMATVEIITATLKVILNLKLLQTLRWHLTDIRSVCTLWAG